MHLELLSKVTYIAFKASLSIPVFPCETQEKKKSQWGPNNIHLMDKERFDIFHF